MSVATLYQFELCPYCNKVKSGLAAKGIAYRTVEVNPMNKKELPSLPEQTPRKVPVIELDGELIQDSTTILHALDARNPDPVRLLPDDSAARDKTEMVEHWVDDDLTFVLPTVIYGTWGEAAKAAQVTARTSNFGFVQNLLVRGGGSLIMHQVAKRIVKRRGGGDPHEMLASELDKFESWLGDDDFVCGDAPSLGDIATHGALTCIREFPAFARIMQRPRIQSWYERVQQVCDGNRAQA